MLAEQDLSHNMLQNKLKEGFTGTTSAVINKAFILYITDIISLEWGVSSVTEYRLLMPEAGVRFPEVAEKFSRGSIPLPLQYKIGTCKGSTGNCE
jgi:hypothetical protein